MTTYLWLSVAVLAPVLALSAVVLIVRPGVAGIGRTLLACAATLAGLVLLTVVFDSAIVGTGIVAYDPVRILGARIGAAPVEDFAYPIAAAVALPALWCLLARRSDHASGRASGHRPDHRPDNRSSRWRAR